MPADKTFTMEEVSRHASPGDCWVVINGLVFDVTKFAKLHPGGAKVLLKEGGKDASKKFKMFHKDSVLTKYTPRLCIGRVQGAADADAPAAAAAAAASALVARPFTGQHDPLDARRLARYGNQLPYAEPNYLQGAPTPYLSASHVEWRARIRAFVDTEVAPFVHEWDEKYGIPADFYKKFYAAGFLPGVVGAPWPKEYVDVPPPNGYDYFHEQILIDEVSRPGSGGFVWSLFGGLSIGLPPVLKFGSKQLKDRVARPCLTGEKVICLAITEPGAGSDVAGLTTTARKTADGRHYIVNGQKKWITNGIYADYFTVAVRTGGPGAGGLSMLLVEKDMPGVKTRHMKCMGVWPSGTTYITFEDVKVPVENLIGREGHGFKQIMVNFNHERWSLCCQVVRLARVCVEESFGYAMKRKTFGKNLVEHQLIRHKLSEMIRKVESTQAWLDQITFQMCSLPPKEVNEVLGGAIALLKVQCTKTFEFCAREAAQIFGGASYVRGGAGEKIERLYREVRAYAIPGGSEEIMSDLGARQAIKQAAKL